jgi:hypothetical protein
MPIVAPSEILMEAYSSGRSIDAFNATNHMEFLLDCLVYRPIAPSEDKWVGRHAIGHTTERVLTHDVIYFIHTN